MRLDSLTQSWTSEHLMQTSNDPKMMLRYKTLPGPDERPESTLLVLSRCGGAPKARPTSEDFSAIVENINSGQAQILFPWFWTHEDVREFRSNWASKIDPDLLIRIIDDCHEIFQGKSTHWIERVNLFHLYGLSRMVSLATKDSTHLSHISTELAPGLVAISARNTELIRCGADAAEAMKVIKILEDRKISRIYAEYLLFYYGGIEKTIDVLSTYIGRNEETVIPAAIVALTSTFDISKRIYQAITERLISKLANPNIRLQLLK